MAGEYRTVSFAALTVIVGQPTLDLAIEESKTRLEIKAHSHRSESANSLSMARKMVSGGDRKILICNTSIAELQVLNREKNELEVPDVYFERTAPSSIWTSHQIKLM